MDPEDKSDSISVISNQVSLRRTHQVQHLVKLHAITTTVKDIVINAAAVELLCLMQFISFTYKL